MMRTLRRGLLAALALFVLSGCTAAVSSIKMASTNNIDLNATYVRVQDGVEGKTTQLFVLLYFQGDDMNYYNTLGSILAEHDGDLMTDVEVTTTSYFFLIGAYSEYKIQGTVWRAVEEPVMGQIDPAELFQLREVDGRRVLVGLDGQTHEVSAERAAG